METTFVVEEVGSCSLVWLQSKDGTNRLHKACVEKLTDAVRQAARKTCAALIMTGNDRFFSMGADLAEISALNAVEAYEFSRIGQELMSAIDEFPAPTYAAISGFCMGGGLDIVLACRYRIASPHSIFGHRGAALGLMTGWGGTQRLPRLIGKGRALGMFVTAAKITAQEALRIGLIDAIADHPVGESLKRAAR
ncbi:MAG TPA: enoyl-CoA hydratase/isomerase family protein [Candidatus Sulfotelmatobacter sp.]|nr:enoyl-CoA hydratase/isomerase family protein [Candidatus Sulfotelmatobacter sp.]